jgi:hypothetical protein
MTVLGVGGGIRFNPPTPWRGRARTHAILSSWTDVEMPQVKEDSIYVGDARVQCFDLTWWQGVFPVGPPSTDWVGHARYHRHVKLNINVKWHGLERIGRWSCAVVRPDLHLAAGGMLTPPSTDWVGCARTLSAHVAWQYLAGRGFIPMNTAFSKLNFKTKFQTYIFEILRITSRTYVCVHN